jgi:hypothetical protein
MVLFPTVSEETAEYAAIGIQDSINAKTIINEIPFLFLMSIPQYPPLVFALININGKRSAYIDIIRLPPIKFDEKCC